MSASPSPDPAALSEMRREIAEAKGWTDVRIVPIFSVVHPAGGDSTNASMYPDSLVGIPPEPPDLHTYPEGCDLVPNWPEDIGAAWGLVEEMAAERTVLIQTFADPPHIAVQTCYARLYTIGPDGKCKLDEVKGEGETVPEAICHAYLAWKKGAQP